MIKLILNEIQKNLYKKCIFLKEEEENKEEQSNETPNYITIPDCGVAYKSVKTLNTENYEKNKSTIHSFLLLANSEISRIYNSRDMKFHATSESVLKVTDTKLSLIVYGIVEKNGKKAEKTLSVSATIDNYKDISINRKNV